MSKNYAGIEDLLCDETFLSWYFKTDVRAEQQWQQWIADNPDSSHRIQQAVDLLSSLTLKEESLTREQISRSEKLLLERIHRTRKERPGRRIFLQEKRWIVAASIILLAAGIYGVQRWEERHQELHTVYGEVRANSLSDGTDVMINANSHIRCSSGWVDGKDREVWLTGEAFFHVRKTPLKSRFIVHADHFDVVVTGTRFNVINRQGKASVMLQEGSVTLRSEGGAELKMAPGDFVEYSNDGLVKRTVRTDSVIAWKEHKLSFDSTSLKDVAAIIEEQYGVKVRLASETVGNKTVSGIMPNDNLEVLLRSMEATTEFRVVRRGDEIIIQDQ
jgi:ferric-dicitrate binding protein FerR (iron transport regulator)